MLKIYLKVDFLIILNFVHYRIKIIFANRQ